MATAFEDGALGLKLKGYNLVPNDALETKIAIYTPDRPVNPVGAPGAP